MRQQKKPVGSLLAIFATAIQPSPQDYRHLGVSLILFFLEHPQSLHQGR